MRQVSENNKNTVKKSSQKNKKKTKSLDQRIPKIVVSKVKRKRSHPQYGTSKLEEDFAHEFLDKLKLDYEYQFEAKDIGRFYDFRILPDGPIFEVNGGYWHGDSRLYEEKDLNKTQLRAQKIDEYKQKWALMHGIPIYYFWEKDIRENPSMVLERIKEILYLDSKKTKRGRQIKKTQ